MDYQKIYNQIIERAKNRQLEGYKEKHHIIPKCIGGLDNKENLIELTAREHFLCHLLLVEIYPNEGKLKQALWLMAIGKKRCKYNEYRVNSRIYERLKKDHSKIFSEFIKGNKNMLGKNHKESTKQKISLTKTGKTLSDNHKLNISKGNKGKKHSKLHKIKLQDHSSCIPVIQYNMQGNILQEFKSVNDASRITNFPNNGIGDCCRGRQNTAYGFIWKYKGDNNISPFNIVYQYDKDNNILNIFKSRNDLRDWLKLNSKQHISTTIQRILKKVKNGNYNNENYVYSLVEL